jgi:hypothetical protein
MLTGALAFSKKSCLAPSRPLGDVLLELLKGDEALGEGVEPPTIEVIDHEESGEVRFSDGRPSVYFYHDDNPGRRSVNDRDTPQAAHQKADELARAEREKVP